jgi:polyisoprenoid-binding protein YceI
MLRTNPEPTHPGAFPGHETMPMENHMSKRLLPLVIAVLPLAAAAAPDSYTIDPVHSSISFTIDHLGLSLIHGRFDRFSGKFQIDRAAKTGSVDLVIETASIDTNDNEKGNRAASRDEHLRSADFFNAAEFPRATYRSTRVVFAGDTPAAVEGNFTLLGVTKPVAFRLDRFRCNPATATARERCGGDATGKLKRSDFGMTRGIPSIGDEVALSIGFEANRD